jgi:hypothetical protein
MNAHSGSVEYVVDAACPPDRIYVVPAQVPTCMSSAEDAYRWAHGICLVVTNR